MGCDFELLLLILGIIIVGYFLIRTGAIGGPMNPHPFGGTLTP